MSVILYPFMFRVALLMDWFVLCVLCLGVCNFVVECYGLVKARHVS